MKARQASLRSKPLAAFVITMSKPRTNLGRPVQAALEDYGFPPWRAGPRSGLHIPS